MNRIVNILISHQTELFANNSWNRIIRNRIIRIPNNSVFIIRLLFGNRIIRFLLFGHYSLIPNTNSTKNVMKSHSYDVIPYKFNQKMSWNLKIIILFHSNSSKNVMDSQNHDIILYKIYQKCHDISKTWHYSIQILPKHHKISQSWHYTIQILQKTSWNVMKSHKYEVIPYKFYQKCR